MRTWWRYREDVPRLTRAVLEGEKQEVARILADGVSDIDETDNNRCTALYHAVNNGEETKFMVALLLAFGADPMKGSKWATTPLTISHQDDITLMLVDWIGGWGVIDTSHPYNSLIGDQLLWDACRYGDIKKFEFLMKHHAGTRYTGGRHATSLLHVAVENRQYEMCKVLIKWNPKLIQSKDNSGATPLHIIAKTNPLEFHPGFGDDPKKSENAIKDIMSLLLKDVSPDILNAQDNVGDTPCHYAARMHNLDSYIELINAGADAFRRNMHGISAVDISVAEGGMIYMFNRDVAKKMRDGIASTRNTNAYS
jgi:ankyrin repeat protein